MSRAKTGKSRRKGRFFPFLIGFLLGAAAGGAVGLLLAPRSGAESRHLLSENLNQRREGASKVVNETRHQAQKNSGDLLSQVQERWSLLLGALQAGKQAAREKHQELRQKQSAPKGGKA
ncbi:gas vesicle protein [bacterium (Candidatus Blackallbacteria) CG17_big_fil_post_rev_8_21_14_2_50_48_46]|uniref:Gas vesicle protein n=1 Tax=bacterium (Candidatus Blackallbacteria) CG17_big_fil_post_rev_8_21_14_2_50_48_46 TaxID=2014261 RepID=A0A2M7G908_9BACT|nr:MAG: gas vesicle protein [bacterium (Candidatus Blackallbacteria) CG18_big_fil_WC_8_21_14_2_50_49_26]PIW18590.1 MAG: gas vesicle protein [bacterium (Candidatus Blackallbacteria) CG17_big_fil_post_rev_8_21_14_2_50_48_46]PIW46424.1 MAG: gas vesicle protein [bacterium (Candidatus Blackallbacteria) CG13_big_fil_rev_8_21_14_2_50_49_14]